MDDKFLKEEKKNKERERENKLILFMPSRRLTDHNVFPNHFNNTKFYSHYSTHNFLM